MGANLQAGSLTFFVSPSSTSSILRHTGNRLTVRDQNGPWLLVKRENPRSFIQAIEDLGFLNERFRKSYDSNRVFDRHFKREESHFSQGNVCKEKRQIT